jgi:hypothetical protein
MSFGKINPDTYTGDVFNNGAGEFMAMGAEPFRNCSGGCGGYNNAFSDSVARAQTILANQGGVQQQNTGTTTPSGSTTYAPAYNPEEETKPKNTFLYIGIGAAVLVVGFVVYKKFIKK